MGEVCILCLQMATTLLRELCASVDPGEPIYHDVPEVNPAGMELARQFNMKRVFGTARMYFGGVPRIHLEKVFGVTTFELG